VGRLSIHVPADRMTAGEEAEELELLAWGAATAIWLSLERSWRLRVAGVFAALTELHICCGRMEGGDISALVPAPEKAGTSRQVGCCVRRLHTLRLAAHSLFARNTRRLEVVAPVLEDLCLFSYRRVQAYHISALKLAKLAWYGDAYDHHRHQFSHICRHLRLLESKLEPRITPVMKQFDEVDELSLGISIPIVCW
jgi:hypothetical protein